MHVELFPELMGGIRGVPAFLAPPAISRSRYLRAPDRVSPTACIRRWIVAGIMNNRPTVSGANPRAADHWR
jgi:hypothetical protein